MSMEIKQLFLEIRVSRKAIQPFCLCSMVKLMRGSIELSVSLKLKTEDILIIAKLSSTNLFKPQGVLWRCE